MISQMNHSINFSLFTFLKAESQKYFKVAAKYF